MNKTYLETERDYKLFIDFEKSEVSIEGNFLGEERSVRNQKGELWNRTIDYLTQKGTKFYEETILRDAISGVESKPDLGSKVEAETGVSNPFKSP